MSVDGYKKQVTDNYNACKVCDRTPVIGLCSRCKTVAYCSELHAEQDWGAGHHRVCGALAVQTPLDVVLTLPVPSRPRPAAFAQHLSHHQWAVLEHNRNNSADLDRQLQQAANGFYVASTLDADKLELVARSGRRFSLKPLTGQPDLWVLKARVGAQSRAEGTAEELLASTLGPDRPQDVGNFLPKSDYIGLVAQVRPYVDVDDTAYRRVLRVEPTLEAVYMCLRPGETVPLETHPDTVQYVEVLGGTGQATVNGEAYKIDDRHAIIIPSNTPHVLVNTHYNRNLRLITVYDSDHPEHPAGLVEARQPKETSSEHYLSYDKAGAAGPARIRDDIAPPALSFPKLL